jgi:pyruvate,orthophosphate dikinase
MTSHAAVVARGWGKPCICGCDALKIDEETKTMQVFGKDGTVKHLIKEGKDSNDHSIMRIPFHSSSSLGDYISLNGNTGEVLVGTFTTRVLLIFDHLFVPIVLGKQELNPASVDAFEESSRFMSWVDEKRKLRVLANVDTPKDAAEARRNGAQGIPYIYSGLRLI